MRSALPRLLALEVSRVATCDSNALVISLRTRASLVLAEFHRSADRRQRPLCVPIHVVAKWPAGDLAVCVMAMADCCTGTGFRWVLIHDGTDAHAPARWRALEAIGLIC